MRQLRYIAAAFVILLLAFVLNRGINHASGPEKPPSTSQADESITAGTEPQDITEQPPRDYSDFVVRVTEFEKTFFLTQIVPPSEARAALVPYVSAEFLSSRTIGLTAETNDSSDVRVEVDVTGENVYAETDEADGVAYVTTFVTIRSIQGDSENEYTLAHQTVWVKQNNSWLVFSSDL